MSIDNKEYGGELEVIDDLVPTTTIRSPYQSKNIDYKIPSEIFKTNGGFNFQDLQLLQFSRSNNQGSNSNNQTGSTKGTAIAGV